MSIKARSPLLSILWLAAACVFARGAEATTLAVWVMRTVQMMPGYGRVRLWSIAALAAAAFLVAGSAKADPLATWVELTGLGQASIRAIVKNTDQCPTLSGGVRMKIRAEPADLFASVRVCEAMVAGGTKNIQLGGEKLPLPGRHIRKIVVLGDTGCRETAYQTQKCDDKHWPFKALAAQAATAAPDLVIHVGDYLYREPPCSSGEQHPCPTDYGWAGWDADFFTPARKLLEKAPWLMVRGNHEACGRAAEGWFRFLDHAPWRWDPGKCPGMSDFFVAGIGDLRFAVLDSASLAKEKQKKKDDLAVAAAGSQDAAAADEEDDDEDASAEQPPSVVADLTARYKAIAGQVKGNAWILTHVTFNGVRVKDGGTVPDSTVQQATLGPLLSSDVRMVVSGHIHMFEAISFADDKPPQLVGGNGGTKLAKKPDIPPTVNGLNVARSKSIVDQDFGYMVWERDAQDATRWSGTLFDQGGAPIGNCGLQGRKLACQGKQ
jgi:hypothetical protein